MTSSTAILASRIPLSQAYEDLDQGIRGFLKTVPPSIKPYTGHLSSALGKNLRGKALLLAAMGDDELLEADAVQLAVAIEMFHLATLVHDDIIDNADLRRGQASLQAKFGKKTAVLCGDYLLARSLELSAKVMSGRKKHREQGDFSLMTYASLICLGEIRQHANNFNLDLSLQRYCSIIRGKTAILFEAALVGGEHFVLESERIRPENTESYKKIGRYMGMIFQMMDDLIDIEQSEAQAKKPILSDLKAGVVTLPLILAMEKDATIKIEIQKQQAAGEIQPQIIQKKILASGGIQETRRFAQEYYDKARKEIQALQLIETKQEALITLLDKAMGKR